VAREILERGERPLAPRLEPACAPERVLDDEAHRLAEQQPRGRRIGGGDVARIVEQVDRGVAPRTWASSCSIA